MRAFATKVASGSSMKVNVPGGGSIEFGEIIKDTKDAEAAAKRRGTAIKVLGDPDQLKVLFKVQGDGWQKSTKALPVPGGCVLQMTTERRGMNGSWTTAEAIEFVPGVTVVPGTEKGQFKLEKAPS
jgi:hypothetical protein